jgi:cobalt-zinc-cadmium efflux system membrane fusion protein
MQVELHLFGNAAQRTRPGAKVRVQRLLDEVVADTEISRVLPDVDVRSQSVLARAAIRNDDGLWRPGSAVQAEIELSRVEVPRAMPADALQTWRNMPVAFIRVGDIYEVRPVVTGRRDSRFVEVLDGLKAGDEIVVGQSYLIKADIEKSGATHDH